MLVNRLITFSAPLAERSIFKSVPLLWRSMREMAKTEASSLTRTLGNDTIEIAIRDGYHVKHLGWFSRAREVAGFAFTKVFGRPLKWMNMWFIQRADDAHKFMVTAHEVGHALLARASKIPVLAMTVEREGRSAGHIVTPKVALENGREAIQNMIMLVAGHASTMPKACAARLQASSEWIEALVPQFWHGCRGDAAQLREVLATAAQKGLLRDIQPAWGETVAMAENLTPEARKQLVWKTMEVFETPIVKEAHQLVVDFINRLPKEQYHRLLNKVRDFPAKMTHPSQVALHVETPFGFAQWEGMQTWLAKEIETRFAKWLPPKA